MRTGVILQPSYRVRRNRPVIQLFGRLESGEPFLVEDDRFKPYFFIRTRDAEHLREDSEIELQETELTNLDGENVTRATVALPSAIRSRRDLFSSLGLPTYEADIRFTHRYLMDHALRVGIGILGKAQSKTGRFISFYNPDLVAADAEVPLDALSLDLETTPDASRILSAALAGCQHEEVHLVSDQPVLGAIPHPDERTLLIALAERIRELDPDLLVGWNVVEFDLQVFHDRCEAHHLTAKQKQLGRTPGAIDFSAARGFLARMRAEVPGRIILDGLPLAREALRLPDYRLETVAQASLGKGKLIQKDTSDPAAEIMRLYQEEPEALVAYNLEDARLVLEILEQEGLIELTRERGRLTGMQLDRVSASIASFDLVYLPELRRHGVVAPNADPERESSPIAGGAVLQPTPGLSRNVAVYDFKSLYPSLMRTFNIDPLALARGQKQEPGSAIVAPNGAHLCRSEAILSQVLERFMGRREAAKQRGDRHADQAIKIMMNSMFGIFAAPACRFFSPELANAITQFGQQTLAWTQEIFESADIEVLYGDTDSVFVQLPVPEDSTDAVAAAMGLRDRVATELSHRIQQQYDVEATLELELEKIFSRFFLPPVRGGGSGSKKRYAGWTYPHDTGQLQIVGLESVRRDWPAIARQLQEGMLTRLFQDQEILPFVREVVAGLKSGSLDAELVYIKRIRKGTSDRYTASSPPHVQAARKLEARGGKVQGGIIRYVITATGPEPVLPGGALPQTLDRTHYLDRVLRPIADAILPEVGSSFAEAIGEPQQLNLI